MSKTYAEIRESAVAVVDWPYEQAVLGGDGEWTLWSQAADDAKRKQVVGSTIKDVIEDMSLEKRRTIGPADGKPYAVLADDSAARTSGKVSFLAEPPPTPQGVVY